MKIEIGKFYRNAKGEKVGPILNCSGTYVYYDGSISRFRNNGVSCYGADPDLIAEWTEENNGPDTLGNLNLKAGDVVEWAGKVWVAFKSPKPSSRTSVWAGSYDGEWISDYAGGCTVVSRAPQKPKTFGELSDEEKGALLLAHHQGKRIYFSFDGVDWSEIECPMWSRDVQYRVAPTRIAGTCEVDPEGNPMFDTWKAE